MLVRWYFYFPLSKAHNTDMKYHIQKEKDFFVSNSNQIAWTWVRYKFSFV